MNLKFRLSPLKIVSLLAFLLIFLGAVCAQVPVGSLRGQVTDPSGAAVAGATVAVLPAEGTSSTATTNRDGIFEVKPLAPGKYTVQVFAPGFAQFSVQDVAIAAGSPMVLNVHLAIQEQQERVIVSESTTQLDTSGGSNANSLTLKGKDLEALSDDPDELQDELTALAGPSAGPNGGQIYIDGFTAGQLPPKSSIREIRINQNPFSAEYDKLGYGRIEVFTKPGTDKYHGQFSVEGNSSGMNSRNPFLHVDPVTHVDPFQPYDSVIYMGNIGGPINKKASFFFNVQRCNIDEIAVVNTPTLDPNTLNQIQLSESVPNPRTRTNISPRIDYQIGTNNTLTARYQFYRDTQQNAGVGGSTLPEAGYDTTSCEHTFQIRDTQILGSKIVNETRFQYLRENSRQTPLSTLPSINVQGAFSGGGSNAGAQTNHQDHYELQNYTSMSLGKNFLKFGGRLRAVHEIDTSSAGFNGSFTFPDLNTYQIAAQYLANGDSTAPGATQFRLDATTSGFVPSVPVKVADAGLYIQDDWRVRPNLTLSGGLRFETQNAIHDHADWAPRLGFAWGIGNGKSAPKSVLRGGFGLFYDRFSQDLVLNADRLNGITQQQYAVSVPTPSQCTTPPCPVIDFFPTVPPVNRLPPQTTSPIYRIAPRLHSPYIMQTAFSLERQVTKIANVTISYLNSLGVHQFLSIDTNAPTPGTPNSTGPRPNPAQGDIYHYSSDGLFRQNQLIATFNIRAGAKLSLFGNYSLNYANSDASGASSFPSNQYDLAMDYGRASFDVRHRVFMAGTIGLSHGVRLSPFMIFTSGSPYNVTAGQDLSGDLLFNDRPAFGTNSSLCPFPTAAACLHYVAPTGSYVPIPINYLTGPNNFTLNLRLAKTFGFGPEVRGTGGTTSGDGAGARPPGGGGGGPGGGGGGGGGFGRGPGGGGGFGGGAPATGRRYNLTFSVNARNILNKVNVATPIGVLSSPNFGQSIALAGGPFSSAAANRKIELQAMFSF